MSISDKTRIVEADRIDNSVVVTFDDGSCALYSAAMLYALLDQAEKVDCAEREEEE